MTEGLIIRMFMDMDLPYSTCINQQAGGGVPLSSSPEIDGVKYAVYIVFNRKGIQPFRLRMSIVSHICDDSLQKFKHATDALEVDERYKLAASAILIAHQAFSELVIADSPNPPQKPTEKRKNLYSESQIVYSHWLHGFPYIPWVVVHDDRVLKLEPCKSFTLAGDAAQKACHFNCTNTCVEIGASVIR